MHVGQLCCALLCAVRTKIAAIGNCHVRKDGLVRLVLHKQEAVGGKSHSCNERGVC
jgi:hypothetical protein